MHTMEMSHSLNCNVNLIRHVCISYWSQWVLCWCWICVDTGFAWWHLSSLKQQVNDWSQSVELTQRPTHPPTLMCISVTDDWCHGQLGGTTEAEWRRWTDLHYGGATLHEKCTSHVWVWLLLGNAVFFHHFYMLTVAAFVVCSNVFSFICPQAADRSCVFSFSCGPALWEPILRRSGVPPAWACSGGWRGGTHATYSQYRYSGTVSVVLIYNLTETHIFFLREMFLLLCMFQIWKLWASLKLLIFPVLL